MRIAAERNRKAGNRGAGHRIEGIELVVRRARADVYNTAADGRRAIQHWPSERNWPARKSGSGLVGERVEIAASIANVNPARDDRRGAGCPEIREWHRPQNVEIADVRSIDRVLIRIEARVLGIETVELRPVGAHGECFLSG